MQKETNLQNYVFLFFNKMAFIKYCFQSETLQPKYYHSTISNSGKVLLSSLQYYQLFCNNLENSRIILLAAFDYKAYIMLSWVPHSEKFTYKKPSKARFGRPYGKNSRLGGHIGETGSRNTAVTQKINSLTLVLYSLLQTVFH